MSRSICRRSTSGWTDGKFYIPISLVDPGSQINAVKVKDKDKATIDILGQVKNATRHRGGPGAPDGAAGARRQPAAAEEERAVLHRLRRWRRASTT